jgi:uncharacterized phage infection (PIP) family protein YhgE
MSLPAVLTYLTVAVAVAIVAVLVVYLILTIIALRRAGDHLAKLAEGLQVIIDNSQPLKEHLTTINAALGELRQGLRSVDNNLVGVAEVFELNKQ